MLLLELVLASGLPLSDIAALIFFDEVMIITGLIGSLVASSCEPHESVIESC